MRIAVLLVVAGSAFSAFAQDAGRPERARMERFEVRGVAVSEALRLFSEATGLSAGVTQDASGRPVSIRVEGAAAEDVLAALARAAGVAVRREAASGVYLLMTQEEYLRDLVVDRVQRTKVFTLLHPNAVAVATAIRDLFGPRVLLTLGVDEDEEDDALRGGTSGTRRTSRSFDDSTRRDEFDSRFSAVNRNTAGGRAAEKLEVLPGEKLSGGQIEELERLRRLGGSAFDDELRRLDTAGRVIYVTANRRNNLVMVRAADEEAMRDIERLVVDMDRPTPQVLLEVKILEVVVGDDFRSVVDADVASRDVEQGPPGAQPRNPLDPSAASGRGSLGGLGNFPLEGGTLVYQYMNDRLRARLQVLESRNHVKILGTPMLLCANDQEARLFVGEERPLVRNFTLQSSVTQGVVTDRLVPTVELQDIGTTLRIVPRINADRTVMLTIFQDSSSANPGAATIPVPLSEGGITNVAIDTVTTTNVEAVIVGKDRNMLAIGGLFRDEEAELVEKTPLLGDVPLLGLLFRREVRSKERRELVLLVTPHVLSTPAEGQERSRERLRDLSKERIPGVRDEAESPADGAR